MGPFAGRELLVILSKQVQVFPRRSWKRISMKTDASLSKASHLGFRTARTLSLAFPCHRYPKRRAIWSAVSATQSDRPAASCSAVESWTMIVAAIASVCDVPAIAESEMWINGTCINDRRLFKVSLKPALPSVNTSYAYLMLKLVSFYGLDKEEHVVGLR